MNIDFAEYLLNYTDRFFLKGTDILGISFAFVALFVSIASMMMSFSLQCSPQNLVQCTSENVNLSHIASAILASALIGMGIIFFKQKNNNENVFEIEKTIFQNYDYLNERGNKGRDAILKEFQKFYRTKGKNLNDLLASLKPDPTKNPES